ncbi:hypothetical protein AEQU_1568 [Adlercreutzia equolifaciens DSM 19450]|nr:hypothetical protein AEQU_1568 [Adlercreutzia equolifaciens DSM 19450]
MGICIMRQNAASVHMPPRFHFMARFPDFHPFLRGLEQAVGCAGF